MLQSARKLKGFAIAATDGDIGKVTDIYFDDQKWAIRYFVVDTGGWLTGRKVLISPISIQEVDWERHSVRVALTRQQIKASPGIDTEQPVSRQQEAEFYRHYDYPLYWTGPLLWGFGAFPPLGDLLHRGGAPAEDMGDETDLDHEDSHLRSSNEVIGYDIRETNDLIGHVEDFLFDSRDWSIRFMIVNTRQWWPGKHVMISPQLIQEVNWPSRQVVVNVTREAVENSLEYDPAHPPAEDDSADLYRRFDKPPDKT
ncbi:MAG: hypothetical protein A3I66_03705 [Burkholderiales bacterium RIFCSPLOWO2_02_FULL_57_36]|nr:MAG: hypothetical protein A3I66_03705 [Burkholderiales bacterium RIFCSPLOWO2_02_FULL_57_36]